MHRLIGELLALVPPDGSPWPRPARKRWVAAMSTVLDVLYEDGPPSPPPPAAEGEGSAGSGEAPRPEDDEHRPGPSSSSPDDDAPVLDLRGMDPEPGNGGGRHARPGAPRW